MRTALCPRLVTRVLYIMQVTGAKFKAIIMRFVVQDCV